jgi:uncharacterized protein (DUF2062 family)
VLFRRRHRRGVFATARALVWPRAGWRRTAVYFKHRIARLPGSPNSISIGLACGVAISFTPLIGFHLVLGALIAWILRGNIVASAIGTAFGNPWTFPLIWFASHTVGSWFLGLDPPDEYPKEFSLSFLRASTLNVFLPMLLGSIPLAIAASLATYYPVRIAMKGYQVARRLRMEKRQRKLGGLAAQREGRP